MRPLRFCMITTFYPPYAFGGDGLFVYRLANLLARRGHEVHVIAKSRLAPTVHSRAVRGRGVDAESGRQQPARVRDTKAPPGLRA